VHEYSIVQALVERVAIEARAHNAAAVHRLSIRVGEASGVDVELLTTAYATFRERTICADAELVVRHVPARWECSACGADVPARGVLQCRRCGAPPRLAAGDEIVLDRIEMEVS
jgi:hydrogenase nickel incorporation protein HypA/HybF